jgi:putative transposase
LLVELPSGDSDFSTRIAQIKSGFKPVNTALRAGTQSRSRLRRRERDVWQRRFWEHTIRGVADFEAHMDYIHFNPVKHQLVACPHAWPHSSFHRWVRAGRYLHDWACSCARPARVPSGVIAAEPTSGE